MYLTRLGYSCAFRQCESWTDVSKASHSDVNTILKQDSVLYGGGVSGSSGKMANDQQDVQNTIQREILIGIRVTAQLTQTQLSQKLGHPQSYVSKYEAGQRKLTLTEVREIALCCGVSLPDFVALFEQELKMSEG
jgi:ribosome-binding protein aMBF1 (putative translation factor)